MTLSDLTLPITYADAKGYALVFTPQLAGRLHGGPFEPYMLTVTRLEHVKRVDLVLDAMARPGQVHEVGKAIDPPAPLCAAAASVLLTLVDNETPLWLDPAAAEARSWIAFHTGAPAARHVSQHHRKRGNRPRVRRCFEACRA